MTPDRILEALKQLVLAALAFATSLGGAAGGLPPGQAKAVVREVLSVPQLPSDELLTVDEVDETEIDEEEDEGETEDEDLDDEDLDEDLDDEELEEIDPDELDEPVTVRYLVLRGPITARPDDGVVGTWTIAGRDVEVTETTVVSTRAARSQVGDWAQVKVEVQAPADEETLDDEETSDEGETTTQEEEDGEEPDESELELDTLVACSLSVMSSTNLGRVVGIIDSIGDEDDSGVSTWVVSGVTITVDSSTHIVGTPEEGRLADVHGAMTVEEPTTEEEELPTEGNDNEGDTEEPPEETEVEAPAVSFVAKLIVVRGTANLAKQERQEQKQQAKAERAQEKAQEKEQKRSTFRFSGVIESMDTETGAWVISGQTVLVSEATSVNEKKGTVEDGAQVRVLAQQDENGDLVALEIEVLKPKGGNNASAAGKPAKENRGQSKKK